MTVKITPEDVRSFLLPLQGRVVDLAYIRKEMNIAPQSQSWFELRKIMSRLADQKVVRASGKHDGVYKVIEEVSPVDIFSNENDAKFDLWLPRDWETGMEFPFASEIVAREGDMWIIAGVSNYGKTTLAMNFLGENIVNHQCVLMGNEYTTLDKKPSPRLVSRIKAMDWVTWKDDEGKQKFTLLPVHTDFAEHVVPGALNIIDWIDAEDGEFFMMGKILREIKKAVGNGFVICTLQKEEYKELGRGAGTTRDYADAYFMVDPHGKSEARLTIGKVKESTDKVTGRSWAYRIDKGVKLMDVREVVKCHSCNGQGKIKYGECLTCGGIGWINK